MPEQPEIAHSRASAPVTAISGPRTERLGWVTFDLWSTLFHDSGEREAVRSHLRVARMAEALRLSEPAVTDEAMERAYRESWPHCEQVWERDEEVGPEEQVEIILQYLDPALSGRLGQEARTRLEDAYITPILDSPPVLAPYAREALDFVHRSGLGIGLICNTGRSPGWVMREIFRRNRILDYFAVTVFSNEVGRRKPDPEIFAIAVAALGARPERTVHIGDDLRTDIGGARRAGLRAILVRPERVSREVAPYDVQIEHLGLLPGALGEPPALSSEGAPAHPSPGGGSG